MKRRVLSLIMAVIMVLGMFPVTAFAALLDNEVTESSTEETKTTVIPITEETMLPYVTSLKVEGVDIVHHSGWYANSSVKDQRINIYVAEHEKNSVATISIESVEGQTVKGEIIDATKDIQLVDWEAEYVPEEPFEFGPLPQAPYTQDFYGQICVFFCSVLSIDKEEILINKGETEVIEASVPEGIFEEAPVVTWESSDESVATVDAAGVVTGVAHGKATITAKAEGYSRSCEVEVAPVIYNGTGKPNNSAYISAIRISDSEAGIIERMDLSDEMNPVVYINKKITSEEDLPELVYDTAIANNYTLPITEDVMILDETEAVVTISAKALRNGSEKSSATWSVTYISEVPEVETEDLEHNVSMRLNEWLDLNLAELVPGGETYSYSDDGESWIKVEGTEYRYYPAGDGIQKAYFRAYDVNGNVIKNLVLTADVEEVPDSVEVTLSITGGTMNIFESEETGYVMVPTTFEVPYFDLGLYGLEDYYYNPRCYSTHTEGDSEHENNQLVGTKEMAEGVVTVMHAYIYATEVYYLGYDEEDAGTGASYESEEIQEAISWTGGVGSSFMSFWNHGTNLNYYVDWTYPLGAPAWGSTSDQIALYGGEEISIHLIHDSSVMGSNFSFFTTDGTTNKSSCTKVINAVQGDKVELTAVKTLPDWDGYTTSYVPFETNIYWINGDELCGDMNDWNNSGLGVSEGVLKTDKDGKIVIDTTELKAGTYYFAAEGFVDRNAGTETGAAVVKLELKKSAPKVKVTVTVDDNEVIAENTGVIYTDAYDHDVYVYFAKLPYAGDISITDDQDILQSDIDLETRGLMYVGGRKDVCISVEIPFDVVVENNTTTKAEVEELFGTIPGLSGEGTVIHGFYVYEKQERILQNLKPLYILITEGKIIPAEGISLDKTELSMAGGKTYTLRPTVKPANTTYDNLTWTSSNPKVAEVSANGTISTYCKGTAVITAKLPDGKEASCTVTVTTNEPKAASIFSGSKTDAYWPEPNATITNVTVGGVLVSNSVWYEDNCYVTLDPEYTPDDSVITFSISTSGASATVNGGPVSTTIPLENGKAAAEITGTGRGKSKTRTVYFSKTGYFDVAPQLILSATDSVNRVIGEAYERKLTDVFRNYAEADVSYTVAIDGADPVAADANFSFVPEAVGTHTLVFQAKNAFGESSKYTVTIKVFHEKDTVQIGNVVEGKGALNWIGVTDGKGDGIEGIKISFDKETNTVYITLPTDYPLQGSVRAYFGMERTADGYPLITTKTATTGTYGGRWNYNIRTMHPGTLTNGALKQTVYFVKTGINDRETYTLVYQRELPENYFELDVRVPENGDKNLGWSIDKIFISGDEGKVVACQWNTDHKLNILLDKNITSDDLVMNFLVSGRGSISGAGDVTLENGSASRLIENTGPMGKDYQYQTFTVNFKKGYQPALMEGVASSATVTTPCLEAYDTDLSKLFADGDGDSLSYQVRVDGGEWTSVEGDVYGFVPAAATKYCVEFRAYDGYVYSDDIYTLEVNATNASTTYDVIVKNLPAGTEFYCAVGIAEDKTDAIGEKLTAERKDDGSYVVKVFTNVSKIVAVCGNVKTSAFVSVENETNVINFQKTNAIVSTLAGNPAEGSISVKSAEGMVILGESNVFYLVYGETYTFIAEPVTFDEWHSDWKTGNPENNTITEAAEADVPVHLQVNKPKTVTIDADADLTVFYQRSYYVMSEEEALLTKDNGDGTITYTYACPEPSVYAMGHMFFATKDDLIDKAGYMMGDNNFVVSWKDETRKGDYRGTYDLTDTYGKRGDDSILVNINKQNHLVLNQGETFRLRSFRIWEIINTDTENVMIEPEFIYSGYDKNIISMVSANENLTTQLCGTSGNNWMDMTAIGSGTTFLEVGYEAVDVISEYEEGAWGGAYSQTDFTFNAIDPNRTALIVVQTDGNAATDVSFGIDCLCSNVEQNYQYDKNLAVAWDAEFDTVYFTEGDHRDITFNPSAKTGSIAKVEISYDKGVSFKALTADENGVYTASIYAGNNVIKVTKDDGTTAYQVVRGDKVTYNITMITDIDGDNVVDPGDTVRVNLYGLHNPIGKMSGVYNPGFSSGQRVTYTWNGQHAQQSGYFQYDFITNAWIDVTVPEDAQGSYSLTDGYIAFNVFGDLPGNHRNLRDGGCPINTTAKTFNYTRSLLPEIVVYSAESDTVIGDVNGDGEIDTADATFIISYYYGKTEFDAEQIKAADVNKDGEVDTVDATFVISYYYGKIESFA